MFNLGGIPENWLKPLMGVLLLTAMCMAIYWQTWGSMVSIWLRSDTYAHGFLVPPISLWLIWIRRKRYVNLIPEISYIGLIAIIIFGFLWLTAHLVHVLVIEQFAIVGILTSAIWSVLGNNVTGKLLFPILFLFLMAPFGEDLVPYLMEYTATFVVAMLRLTGISVYREGLHFTLVSGNWSVVDACSGIRYLIASITLGFVYMYLNYSSYKKRMLFMLLSILVPILANGLRGYMIVIIGHLSDMKLASGVDHLVYGWLFFGLVMLILFYIGSFWHDPVPVLDAGPELATDSGYRYDHFWQLILAIACIFYFWPNAADFMLSKQAANVNQASSILRPGLAEWQSGIEPDWGWVPKFNGTQHDDQFFMTDGESTFGVYIANFGDEKQGELVNSQNVLIQQKDPYWRTLKTSKTPLIWQNGKTSYVDEMVLHSNMHDLMVFRWYRLAKENTENSYYAKWIQLFKRLSGDNSPELLIVIYTEVANTNDLQQTRTKLQKFAEACCE
jgi:exosortase A